MKKRTLILAILLAQLLAACASPPQPTAVLVSEAADIQAPTAVASSGDEQPPAVAATPEPQSGTEPASDNGMTDYQIVAGESTLSYEVGEVLISQDNRFATAIGITSDISGTISLDGVNPQSTTLGTITVDISLFRSDSNRRDNTIRSRFLESSKYPQVIFTPTEIVGLPESYQPGETINFQVVGDTTIRETTRPLTFDVTAVLDGAALSGQAVTTFLMSDFGFGPISIAGILNTEDEVKIILNFVARP